MAVGYGYIRDTEPTQVDWGQITKDARESIKSIEKDRQARRDKIDENYREFTKMLAERPVGGDTQYQAFMGKYSALVSASMLANLGKLKRGEIGEQQYNTCRATVTSGAEGMIATGKAYIAGHDTAAALQVGNGSAMTKYSNEQSQKLFSLEGVEPMIDPATCETSYAIVGEDGEKEIVDVTQGLRRAVATQTAFNTDGLIENILKAPSNTFIDELKGSVSGQFLKQVDGVVSLDEASIRAQVKAAVQQNSHVFDILKLNKTGYEIVALPDAYYALSTQEERDAMLSDLQKNTKNLYVDKSDTPLVSEKQRLEAENFLVEQVKSRATKSVTESEFGMQDKLQKEINNLVARTKNTKASTDLINARIGEIEGETETDIALNMPAIEDFIRKEIAGPIAAGFERGEGMRWPFTKGWLTDKDNQITKRLKDILGNFGITIDSQRLLKQQIELRVPKPGGTFSTVEIDIRDLTPAEIIEKVTEAVIYVPDENLEFIYNRFIKGSDDDSSSGDPGMGN